MEVSYESNFYTKLYVISSFLMYRMYLILVITIFEILSMDDKMF